VIPVTRIGFRSERIIATVGNGGSNSFVPPPLGQREVAIGNNAGNARVLRFPNLFQAYGIDRSLSLVVRLVVLESQDSVRVLIDIHIEAVRSELKKENVGVGNRKKSE